MGWADISLFWSPQVVQCAGRAENLARPWGVCPLGCPGPSGLHPILPGFSCPFLWPGTMRELPALRKTACSWEATLQSQAEHLSAKHLDYATLKARTRHSWDAYTLRDLHVHLSPQLPWLLKFTFLKEVKELNHPWTSPFFKGNSMHTSFFPDRPTNLWANIALIRNDVQKSDAGR